MGFAASQVRYLILTARKSDLEITVQFINQAKMQLASTSGALFTLTASLDPESPFAAALQARIAAIQSLDKALDLNERRVETQRNAVMAEIEAVQKVIAKSIDMTFKTFAQA